jgi:hypothetical protein
MMFAMNEPEPVTVWMVHLAKGEVDQDVKGTIELAEDGLVFASTRPSGEIRFPYPGIRRVRRLRGSPVLLVEWDREGDRRRTAFYFTQPPPLFPAGGDSSMRGAPAQRLTAVTAFKRSGKRRAQRGNARYLQTMGMGLKDLIQLWADAVDEHVAAGR